MNKAMVLLGVAGMMILSPFVTYFLLTGNGVGPAIVGLPFALFSGMFLFGVIADKAER